MALKRVVRLHLQIMSGPPEKLVSIALFVNRAMLLEWANNNCVLRTLGYNLSLRLRICRQDKRFFHGEDMAGGNCFYIYLCLFYDLYVRLPFTGFQMDILRILNVAPSQLHPNSWGYIQAFGVLCQSLGIRPTTKLFLYFFKTRPNAKRGWVSLSSVSKHAIFQLFAESYKDFKKQFFKIFITDLGRPFSCAIMVVLNFLYIGQKIPER